MVGRGPGSRRRVKQGKPTPSSETNPLPGYIYMVPAKSIGRSEWRSHSFAMGGLRPVGSSELREENGRCGSLEEMEPRWVVDSTGGGLVLFYGGIDRGSPRCEVSLRHLSMASIKMARRRPTLLRAASLRGKGGAQGFLWCFCGCSGFCPSGALVGRVMHKSAK